VIADVGGGVCGGAVVGGGVGGVVGGVGVGWCSYCCVARAVCWFVDGCG